MNYSDVFSILIQTTIESCDGPCIKVNKPAPQEPKPPVIEQVCKDYDRNEIVPCLNAKKQPEQEKKVTEKKKEIWE